MKTWQKITIAVVAIIIVVAVLIFVSIESAIRNDPTWMQIEAFIYDDAGDFGKLTNTGWVHVEDNTLVVAYKHYIPESEIFGVEVLYEDPSEAYLYISKNIKERYVLHSDYIGIVFEDKDALNRFLHYMDFNTSKISEGQKVN